MLAQRMRLRRACCDPRLAVPDAAITGAKLEAFAGIVEERVANKHKALVFSQFVDYLHLLRGERDRMKVSRPHNPSLNSKRSPAQYAPESYRKISTAG